MLDQQQSRRPRRTRAGGLYHVLLFALVYAAFVGAWNYAPETVGRALSPPTPDRYPGLSFLGVLESSIDFAEPRSVEQKRRIVAHEVFGLPIEPAPDMRLLDEAVVHEGWGALATYTRAVQDAHRRGKVLLSIAGLGLLAYLSARTGYRWSDPLLLLIPFYGWFGYFPRILWRATSPERYWSER